MGKKKMPLISADVKNNYGSNDGVVSEHLQESENKEKMDDCTLIKNIHERSGA